MHTCWFKSENSMTPKALSPRLLLLLACVALMTGCATGSASNPQALPEKWPGFLIGYLAPEETPDSLALLPPPPAEDSAAFAQDEAVQRAAFGLRDTQRWTQATLDAELKFPVAAGTFSCAVGTAIDEQNTPRLYTLLRRSLTDAVLATSSAKDRYARTRPFVKQGEPTCAPSDEARLRTNGSYPSGHATAGWAWALILAEVAPEHSDAILARGRTFGESRLVCNVHWQSDVLEGRFMGAGVVARLHANAAFRNDLDAARNELIAARAAKLKPTRDCGAEAARLSQKLPLVL